MRPATRFLAAVRQSAPARTITPGAPTGLTGLRTHPSPRSTLLYLYSSILSKLEQIPEHSVYRQATEALTKKRLAIVDSVKPAGYDSWLESVQHQLHSLDDQVPEQERPHWNEIKAKWLTYKNNTFVNSKMWHEPKDYREVEWDGRPLIVFKEGAKTEEEMEVFMKQFKAIDDDMMADDPTLPSEPLLTLKQVEEMEQQIGAGLIEEVIQVADGENKLVDTMIEHKVWEDLVEKPAEGQWTYFERKEAS